MQIKIFCAAALFAIAPLSNANELPAWRMPDAVYLQGGGGNHVASATVGVVWNGVWQYESGWGRWEANLDLSLGQWRVSSGHVPADGHRNVTQIGLTPVLRLWPANWGGFFVEAGIGANAIFPLYRNDDRRFSTAFNFGDHLGLGWRFGASHEIALRIQHFSNGSIKQPNPGENFVQVRYTRRF
jgi:hypothetical protein